MITKISIKRFKQISDETIDLEPVVVLVGPNNSGKTSLLQAFSLLAIAIKVWAEKRLDNPTKQNQRTGIAINLNDINIPAAEFKELWQNTKTREGNTTKKGTTPIKIEIHAKGKSYDQEQKTKSWEVGFEFSYQRDSVIYTKLIDGYQFETILTRESIGFLPSISGLTLKEDKLEMGSILRRISEGQTATVLRNICYHLYENNQQGWNGLVKSIKDLFAIELNTPRYYPNSGLLELNYNETTNKKMSLSALGSGAKQAILLFAYLGAFKNTISLLDEPDAHLEVIKQANVYYSLSDFAKRNNSQLIIASHSESVLNAAKDDLIISSMSGKFEKESAKDIKAFLKDYPYEQYLLAKQKPFILYYEGTTDLAFIRAFCKKLGKQEYLEQLNTAIYPFSLDGNDTGKAKKHFSALKKYLPNLKGFALFDKLNTDNFKDIPEGPKQDEPFGDIPKDLKMRQWQRNEIENYIPVPGTLMNHVNAQPGDLFSQTYPSRLERILKENIPPVAYDNLKDDFWVETKISDFLTKIFEQFLDETSQPRGTMDKSKFYLLVDYIDKNLLDDELKETLDNIFTHLAKP